MIHRAIVKTGRPMVLSLSPGPTALENAELVGENAQLWRISDDVWDRWEKGKEWSQSLKAQFPVIASWSKYVGRGIGRMRICCRWGIWGRCRAMERSAIQG